MDILVINEIKFVFLNIVQSWPFGFRSIDEPECAKSHQRDGPKTVRFHRQDEEASGINY